MNSNMRQAFSAINAGDTSRFEQATSNINNVNEGSGEQTLLHAAAEHGNTQIIQILINKNANLDVIDKNGMTPLQVAIERKHHEAYYLLRNSGANLEISDKSGARALHWAAQTSNEEITKDLLSSNAEVSPLAKFDSTPLHLAVRAGSLEVLKVLIQNNAPLEVQTKGQTALHIAVLKGNVPIIQELISAGAQVGAKNSRDSTVLHIAASTGKLDVVKLLVSNGATVNTSDVDGFTPADIARGRNFADIAEFLSESAPAGAGASTPQGENIAVAIHPFSKAIFGEAHRTGDLTLTPGSVITEIDKKDGEWWEGTAGGVRGTFPANYVSTKVLAKAICIYTYYASKLDEVNIKKGDEMDIYERRPSGWLRVICAGKGGLVPNTHIREKKPIPTAVSTPISRTISTPMPKQITPAIQPVVKSASNTPPIGNTPVGKKPVTRTLSNTQVNTITHTPPPEPVLPQVTAPAPLPVTVPSPVTVSPPPPATVGPPPPATVGPPPLPATSGPPPLPTTVGPPPRGGRGGAVVPGGLPKALVKPEDLTAIRNSPKRVQPSPPVPTPAPPPVVQPAAPVLPRAKVLYPYEPQHPGDLELTVGMIVELTKTEGGWWEGTYGGNRGIFPANYVERI